jgi:hypothetical protein
MYRGHTRLTIASSGIRDFGLGAISEFEVDNVSRRMCSEDS